MVQRLAQAVLVLLLALSGSTFATQDPPADLILVGGKVVTVDDRFSIHSAVAIRGNRIVSVGSDEQVREWADNDTQIIELKGRFVIPGMVDSHCHPFALGERGSEKADWFDASGTANFAELVERVKAHVASIPDGKWIIGGGWDQETWPGKKLPIHDALSAVSPENPVFLYRDGGNSAFANAKALEIAGITRDTPDPEGGQIHRKPSGEPSGFVVNMGNNLIKAHFPEERKPDSYYREIYRLACSRANQVGLTGWHDAGTGPNMIRIYRQLVDRGELTVRANVMLQNPRLSSIEEMVRYFAKHRVVDYGGEDFLQVRSVKVYFDGALGSRGARLFRPYLDDPSGAKKDGVYEVPPAYLREIAIAGLKSGMQICPHAIGSRANHDLLNAFESALKEHPNSDHRFRSEHAELIHPEDVPRFSKLGVIPSVQPIHCTSDMVFLPERIGLQRCREMASPWRSLIDAGSQPACGSDFMVESHRPLWGIYAAVTRQNHDGEPPEGWYAAQKMTRQEAIKGYTIWPARAAFLENQLGSLEAGKLADLVVLDTDLLTCEPKAIFNAKVDYTIVNGQIVWDRPDQDTLNEEDSTAESDPDSDESKTSEVDRSHQYRAFAASTRMVLIPGGTYKGKKIEPFYMDVDMVNVGQYKAAVKMGICPRPPNTPDISDAWKLGDNRRAQNNVNWYAAQSFLSWVGKRLPTEDEWEWAARGRENGFDFPWGNEEPTADDACWMRYFPEKDICLGPGLVGVDRATSRDGVHDMAGMLWEWTSTRTGDDNKLVVLKGGAWYNDDPEKLKASFRGKASPYHNEVNSDGFRGVMSVKDYENLQEILKFRTNKPLDLSVDRFK